VSVTPTGEVVPVTCSLPLAPKLSWKTERTTPPRTVKFVVGHVKTAPVGSNVVTWVVPAFPAAFAGIATTMATATAASAPRRAAFRI